MTAWVRPISHVKLSRSFGASILIFGALLFSSHLARAQFSQQAPKLVGTGAVGFAEQGYAVALSGDGNTAIVAGPTDNRSIVNPSTTVGAIWIFTRNIYGLWTQEGDKLVGIGAVGLASQGTSVGLSAEGNTVIEGGPSDNSTSPSSAVGAAWVFVRLTKDDCKDGGWQNFISSPGPFTSQGQCVNYFGG